MNNKVTKSYPKLFLRIKAMLWDSTILGLLLIIFALLSSLLPFESKILRGVFVVLPVLSLEPLFVYFRGSSIGHKLAGIRVVNIDEQKSLSVLQCYLRTIVKMLLGLVSLIMFIFSKNYQAIHDYVSRSMVVFIDEQNAPERYKLFEQRNVFVDHKPSIGSRLTILIFWILVFWQAISFIYMMMLSDHCYLYNQCSPSEENTSAIIGLIFIGGLLLIPVLGFMCKLPGAFYTSQRDNSETLE